MSRIHEALEYAERERKSVTPVAKGNPGTTPLVSAIEPKAHRIANDQRSISANAPEPELLERCKCPKWSGTSPRILFEESRENEPATEEFRTLRSRLQQVQSKKPLKKVLVSSALEGEGKSFVAANLAITLAKQEKRRVLLIDGDLRRSQLHFVLGAKIAPGLSDYLRGRSDAQAIMQRCPILSNLYFIPGGDSAESSAELITNGSLAGLISRFENIFDWIIIDSPPMVSISDAASMSQLCDGVLLVVRANSTPADIALKAKSQIHEGQWLGAVLNRVVPGEGPYYRYYRSGSANRLQ